MEVDKRVESAFRCMPLACFDIVDSGLNFYLYFFGLLIQAYYAKAVTNKTKRTNDNDLHKAELTND